MAREVTRREVLLGVPAAALLFSRKQTVIAQGKKPLDDIMDEMIRTGKAALAAPDAARKHAYGHSVAAQMRMACNAMDNLNVDAKVQAALQKFVDANGQEGAIQEVLKRSTSVNAAMKADMKARGWDLDNKPAFFPFQLDPAIAAGIVTQGLGPTALLRKHAILVDQHADEVAKLDTSPYKTVKDDFCGTFSTILEMTLGEIAVVSGLIYIATLSGDGPLVELLAEINGLLTLCLALEYSIEFLCFLFNTNW